MDAYQKMDMIRFSAEFDQRTAPIGQNFCKGIP